MPASAPLALLIRDGSHAGATTRLALKVEQLSISLTKTPIQIPIARSTPAILDLGITRPAITVSGLVDNVGQDEEQTTANQYFHMEKMTLSGPNAAGDGTENQDYHIPYKNFLEHKLITWISSESTELQIEVGDATTPDYAGSGTTPSTGGGIYKVAIQQCQFSQTPGTEDRWVFNIQFVSKLREGITFS